MVILMVPLVLPKPLIATYMYLFPIEILCFYRLMLLLVVKHHKPKNYLNG